MGQRAVTEEDRLEAKRLLLAWLANRTGDIGEVALAAFELHVKNNTFPGEEFMGLAADALELAAIDRTDPIAYETLLIDYLPEVTFKGRQHSKIRFAVMSAAGLRGGLEPDLLDEVVHWIEDYWRYALYGSIALIRAASLKADTDVSDMAQQLAVRHGVDPAFPASGSGADFDGRTR